MTKIQKVILIVWCVAVTACLIYVPLKVKSSISNRTYAKMDYVWEWTDFTQIRWKIEVAPIVLKVTALTVVCGTGFLLTLKRKDDEIT